MRARLSVQEAKVEDRTIVSGKGGMLREDSDAIDA